MQHVTLQQTHAKNIWSSKLQCLFRFVGCFVVMSSLSLMSLPIAVVLVVVVAGDGVAVALVVVCGSVLLLSSLTN